jgi:hypothetical protein
MFFLRQAASGSTEVLGAGCTHEELSATTFMDSDSEKGSLSELLFAPSSTETVLKPSADKGSVVKGLIQKMSSYSRHVWQNHLLVFLRHDTAPRLLYFHTSSTAYEQSWLTDKLDKVSSLAPRACCAPYHPPLHIIRTSRAALTPLGASCRVERCF